MKTALALVATGLATALVAAAPAAAAPTGAFGSVTVLNTDNARNGITPAVAVLPNGVTAVIWSEDVTLTHNVLRMKVRPAGSTTWGAPVTHDPAPDSIEAPSGLRYLKLIPLGTSRFLALWVQANSGVNTVYGAVVNPAAPTLVPVALSEAGSIQGLAAATNAAGRAVVTWGNSTTGIVSFQVLPSPTGAWSGAKPVSTAAYLPEVAVAGDGSFCVQFAQETVPPGGYRVVTRCHSTVVPTGSATWGSTLTAPAQIGLLGSIYFMHWASVAAVGSSFVSALVVAGTGDAPLPGTAIPATKVGLYSKASAVAGSWLQQAVLGHDNELLITPHLQARLDGTVMLAYQSIDGSLSSTLSDPVSMGTFVAERSAAGVWGVPSIAATSTGLVTPLALLAGNGLVATGDSGALLAVALQADVSIPSGLSFATAIRPTRTALIGPAQPWHQPAALFSAAFSPAGRATVAVLTFNSGVNSIVVRTTSMPRPMLLVGARLSAAPRKGYPVRCVSSWSEAKTSSVQWLRGGRVVATGSTYVPLTVDRGRSLACRVTATNPAGSSTSTSVGRTVS